MTATGAVLVVDDSLTVRMDLVEAFEHANLRAIPCVTLADARRALAREAVDVIVLDVVLPDGDGVDLLREIREMPGCAEVAILMLSTEAEVGDRVRALRTGATEYVGKPYDRGYLVARVHELLRARTRAAAPARVTVLCIDDSATFRELLRRDLEAAGYDVLAAATGEEGLRIAADRRPSVMIVDGVLPGIDGATVIRRVRLDAALRLTPCILLTASDEGGAELRALDAGADAFVRKDADTDMILARLAAIVRGTVAHASAAPYAAVGPRKILAVDDSPTYLEELAAQLRGDRHDVVLARSGEEALELLAVEHVDCVLLDLVMPGIGGRETCHRIKAAPVLRDTPVVILTGHEDRAAMLDALAAGADDYIPKSSELSVLKARVRAQIRRKQFEDETRRIREQLLRTEFEAAEARSARQLAEARAALAEELERKNQELEAFSYSVSHDLRAPLRAIGGFSSLLVEDHGAQLDDQARDYLDRIQAATRRMAALIDDLLKLARVTRGELARERIDVTAMATRVLAQLRDRDPARAVTVHVAPDLVAAGDPGLVQTAFENLLGNAWKYSARQPAAVIEVGAIAHGAGRAFFVRDNGVGFDPARADALFRPFQRLHSTSQFEGSGIGLATVQRIVTRHGGEIWAEGAVGHGATIYFTLSSGADR